MSGPKHHGGGLTVGSLRGQPQAARPVAPRASYAAVAMSTSTSGKPVGAMPRRCCGSGCADCPVGRRIRARAGLPTT